MNLFYAKIGVLISPVVFFQLCSSVTFFCNGNYRYLKNQAQILLTLFHVNSQWKPSFIELSEYSNRWS